MRTLFIFSLFLGLATVPACVCWDDAANQSPNAASADPDAASAAPRQIRRKDISIPIRRPPLVPSASANP